MTTATGTASKSRRAADTQTERLVRNGEMAIAVYEQGKRDGDTVILVHGWPDTHHLWDEVAPLLADRFHVVSYDTRGHGRTTSPTHWRSFTLEQLSADFRAVADAVSPDRPVHVLAHDWGSVQVWDAVCEPGAELRIASFTSVSGPNLDHLGRWTRQRLSHPTPRNVWGPLSQLASSGYTFFFQAPMLPRLAFGLLADEKRWKRFLEVGEGTAPQRVHLAETFRRDAISGLRIYRANILPRLRNPRARHTSVPVQLIVNLRDVAVRPAGYADYHLWTDELWRRDINAGHWSPFSHPQVLANATADLIAAVKGEPPSRELRRSRVGGVGKRFDDQLVVITGGGSGIGRETALAFARAGAEIVLCDRNLAAAKETTALIADVGPVAHAYEVDVSDETQVQAFSKTVIARHGVPDVLVNNAGIGHAGTFLDTPSEEFQRVLDVNLNGVIYGCRAFARPMVERDLGGHIVNLSSLAAFSPQRGMGPYATSKSAVFMFSDCLRAELADADIGVSTICPGVVHTNIVATTRFSGLSEEEEASRQAKFDRLYRLRHYGPDKVAKRIVRAVEKNKDIVPVTPEAYQGYYLSRLAPGVVRRFAKLRLL